MTARRFAAPWQVEQIDGGFKVLDANVRLSSTSTLARHPTRRASRAC
jgi:hypothetical protein